MRAMWKRSERTTENGRKKVYFLPAVFCCSCWAVPSHIRARPLCMLCIQAHLTLKFQNHLPWFPSDVLTSERGRCVSLDTGDLHIKRKATSPHETKGNPFVSCGGGGGQRPEAPEMISSRCSREMRPSMWSKLASAAVVSLTLSLTRGCC